MFVGHSLVRLVNCWGSGSMQCGCVCEADRLVWSSSAARIASPESVKLEIQTLLLELWFGVVEVLQPI